MKVTLNLIATNKYTGFLDRIMESSRKFFLTDSDIRFIIYTDSESEFSGNDYIKIKIDHEPWPAPTLKRFHYFLKAKDEILGSDFSFYIDVDSLFVKEIKSGDFGLNGFSGMIGTVHPGFDGTIGTPERNPLSQAYIGTHEKNIYFCGGFFGGDSKKFIQVSQQISEKIDTDLNNGIMPVWHDESHLNRYFFNNPPTLTLSNQFASSEGKDFPETKIVFLDKVAIGGYDFFRN